MTSTRTKLIAGSLGVAAGVAVVATPMLTASAAASGPRGFTLHAVAAHESSIDLGTKGFSAGDTDLSADTLTQHGKRAGWADVSCTTAWVGRQAADQICVFDLHLTHGQIVAQGSVRSGPQGPGTFALAITGGTGRYRTARGAVHVTASNGRSVPIQVLLAR